MNFHKTIGYLAALLLLVGLGVPDSFAQDVQKVTVTVKETSIDDNSTDPVTVTVTAKVTLAAAATVEDVSSITIAASDKSDSYSTSNLTISVTVALGKTTGENTDELVFTMTADGDNDPDDDPVTITGTASGQGAANADIVGETTLSLTDYSAVLPNNAADGSGFRVLIVSPGAGEWAGINRKVKVRLLRRANLASEWGNYNTIKVALRNRDAKGETDANLDNQGQTTTADLYSLTVGGDDDDDRRRLGNLIFERERTATLDHASLNTATMEGTSSSKVTYKRRSRTGQYDTMDFEFAIEEVDGAPNMEKVYAKVTFASETLSATATDDGDEDAGDGIIASYDTETSIYPGNPSAATEKVGDGIFIKLDRDAPAITLFESATVTRVNAKGKPFPDDQAAIIGRFIRTEAKLKAVFRDHSVKFEIIPFAEDDTNTDGVDESIIYDTFEEALVGYEGVVEATDLFASANPRAVIDSVKVVAGKFQLRYTQISGDFEKGDTVERDDMTVRVRISVQDQAGNEAEQKFGDPLGDLPTFTLDGKRPKITIMYPDSAHHRFTEKIEEDVNLIGSDALPPQKLNPLVFKADERLNLGANQLQVIIGDDTLKVKKGRVSEDTDFPGRYVLDLSSANFLHSNKDEDRLKKTPQVEAGQGGSARPLKIIAKDAGGNTGSDVPNVGGTNFRRNTSCNRQIVP